MTKFSNMMVVLICIQLAMILFTGAGWEQSYSATADVTAFNLSIGGIINIPVNVGGTFLEFLMNPEAYTALNFFVTFVALSVVMGGLGLAAGSIFGFKTDFIIFAPLVLTLAATGTVFINFYSFLLSNLTGIFGCNVPTLAAGLQSRCIMLARYLLAFFVGIPTLYYFITIIEWWSNKQ